MSKEIPAYPQPHGLLEGRTVLVTAAAGAGIGFATARRCAEEGARVMLSDIHERRLGEAADELERLTGTRPPVRLCNVTRESEVRALVDSALESLGPLDVLVNNAGLGGTANVVDMSDEQWSSVLDVTLTGAFRMTRAVLPHMLRRGQGCIVNNASVLGWRAQAGQAHYAAAKAGIMALTRCTAAEAAPAGVRVNAVSPSLATHPFLEKVMDADLLRRMERDEMFGRGAAPFEVANVIVFLASDLASYMTGEIVPVSSQHP
jgi:3-oxoacyl-[acyl-carrier protein] reductase